MSKIADDIEKLRKEIRVVVYYAKYFAVMNDPEIMIETWTLASKICQDLADLTITESPTGMLARIGAITYALNANDRDLAIAILARLVTEKDISRELANEMFRTLNLEFGSVRWWRM